MGTGSGVMKMFWIQMEVLVAQHREYTKCTTLCTLKW